MKIVDRQIAYQTDDDDDDDDDDDNFTSSQRLLIIFGRDKPYSILN